MCRARSTRDDGGFAPPPEPSDGEPSSCGDDEGRHAYVVMWPTDFTEGAGAVAAMRGNQSVVLNIGRMKATNPGRSREMEQQRLVDFVAGATHALGGTQAALADGVFLFCPPGAPLSLHDQEPLDSRAAGNALLSIARLG